MSGVDVDVFRVFESWYVLLICEGEYLLLLLLRKESFSVVGGFTFFFFRGGEGIGGR